MKLKNNVAISESGFIFNAEIGTSFTTNPIGVSILKQLKEDTSLENLKESIVKNFEIDPITCEKDLDDFLSIVNQHNLLEEE